MGSDETLRAELAKAITECERLREESARLRLCIGEAPEGAHQDVERPRLSGEAKAPPSATVTADSRPDVKVSLFKDLFRGRDDVYAVRWEGRNGKTPKEIISHHQAIFTERGSDQRSSTRKANHRSLSSPAGRYLLVCSSRLRQEELGSGCGRLHEDVS